MPSVAEEPGLSFAGLLRQLRAEARLTQEELAEAAGVSPRSVSDVERGFHRTVHKDTAQLLAGALGLDGPAGELFVAAARGKAPAAHVLAARQGQALGAFAAVATRALPRDIAAFTGRQAELTRLMSAIDGLAGNGGVVGIHAIDGMAGIGKTTFGVHAAHRLAPRFPDGQFFLPLHAHTRGQRPVGPADALASLLLTAGVPAAQIPPGLEARAGRWRDHVAGKKILLLLDDAASHDQLRPLLPGSGGSLVLITSRRRLAAVEDAMVISLDALPPGDAAVLLARLAARPGLAAGDAAVSELARLCGYLPLAIGMIASQLRHHPAWTAQSVAAGLATARDRLALMRAEDLSVAAAFDLSYADLSPDQQRLFCRLGLVPGPSFDAYAAAALGGTTLEEARRCLDELYDQNLVAEPAPGRYQLHDLLREHARTLADAGGPAESDAATGRLLDYYLHTALAAGTHIPTTWNLDVDPPPTAQPSKCSPPLDAPGQAAAWLEAERANLHAAVHAAAARPVHATLIPAAMAGFLEVRGHWDQALALHQAALDAARRAGDRPGQARALMLQATMHIMTDDDPAAAAALRQALRLYRDLGDRAGQAAALCDLGMVHRGTGDCRSAASYDEQALDLFRDLGHRPGQAAALRELGNVQDMTGDYPAAVAYQRQALEIYRDLGHQYGQVEVLLHLGGIQRETGDYPAAAATFQQAQEVNRDLGSPYWRAWILVQFGVLQRLTGDYPAAAASHQQALDLFRDLGQPSGQGNAHNELGLVQQLTGDYPAAAANHQQALQLSRGYGFRPVQAEALNSLGELHSRTAATGQARDHHGQALAIARDIPMPAEEARALEGIGNSYLHDSDPGQGAAYLEQALAIYQRIGAPDARRVQETLHRHGLTATAEPQPAAPSSEDNQPQMPPHLGSPKLEMRQNNLS
jgi:tetratricopeptide (TPR) repeat protein/transcriptional regulator with XRE-family HTH domain